MADNNCTLAGSRLGKSQGSNLLVLAIHLCWFSITIFCPPLCLVLEDVTSLWQQFVGLCILISLFYVSNCAATMTLWCWSHKNFDWKYGCAVMGGYRIKKEQWTWWLRIQIWELYKWLNLRCLTLRSGVFLHSSLWVTLCGTNCCICEWYITPCHNTHVP